VCVCVCVPPPRTSCCCATISTGVMRGGSSSFSRHVASCRPAGELVELSREGEKEAESKKRLSIFPVRSVLLCALTSAVVAQTSVASADRYQSRSLESFATKRRREAASSNWSGWRRTGSWFELGQSRQEAEHAITNAVWAVNEQGHGPR
jgi:hypothetical protein